jgi:L,D-transpeptidase ErfK/SrfK
MKKIFLILSILLLPSLSRAYTIVGSEFIYEVEKGDSLELICSKLGVDYKKLIRDNNIDPKKPLQIGQRLNVNTRKIVPKTIENGIIINIADKMLYYFKNGELKMVFPVGLGMPSWRGIVRWRTPEGNFKIIRKRKNPTWHVPTSIQWKMQLEGKPVKTIVPPGPDNPLGRYALDTSIPRVVIHETIWPTTVYQYRSHGCVRVLPENMEKFFYEVEINTLGELIYVPVKVAVSEEGKIFLEVHRDVYGKFKELRDLVKKVIEERSLSDKVDWQKIDLVLKEKYGVAEEVTK